MVYNLSMAFTVLKGCFKKRIYDRDHIWSTRPKIFTILPLT